MAQLVVIGVLDDGVFQLADGRHGPVILPHSAAVGPGREALLLRFVAAVDGETIRALWLLLATLLLYFNRPVTIAERELLFVPAHAAAKPCSVAYQPPQQFDVFLQPAVGLHELLDLADGAEQWFLELRAAVVPELALSAGLSRVYQYAQALAPGGTHVATLSNGQKLQVSRLQSRTLRERFLKL